MPGVTLRGYQTSDSVSRIFDRADALICTSYEEGLGLPQLEAQFAGLPVIAPDQPVFREVLATSGIFIDPSNPGLAAAMIERHFATREWRKIFIHLAAENLQRWNAAATADRERVVDLVGRLARNGDGGRHGVVH
jgi:glycosyltransferase involved in cell wall biosynthesis